MKHLTSLTTAKILSVAAMATLAGFSSARDVYVTVDGQRVEFEGTQPQMMGDHVMVPLRGVFERMGANVDWNASDQMVMARRNGTKVELRINNTQAYINGHAVPVQYPAQVIEGSTMVPIRFISESLGADVTWDDDASTVFITTRGPSVSPVRRRDYAKSTNQPVRRETLSLQPRGSVLPVKLDSSIRSQDARVGDRFTATIDTNGGNDYYGLPRGTKVQGTVTFAQAKQGNDPGALGLTFDTILLTDGSRVPIQATLIGLDDRNVRNVDGRLVATRRDYSHDDMKYVGTGAGAGVVVALATHKNVISSGVIGGALGYLYQQLSNKDRAKNVVLNRGTPLGVRFDEEARVRVYHG